MTGATEPPRAWIKAIETIDRFTAHHPASCLPGLSCRWSRSQLSRSWRATGSTHPTFFAFDLSYMLYGALFMLGAALRALKGAHIRTDMLWEQYSDRTKGLVDLCAYLFFFFPA